jgi:hypothetical protein
MIANNRQCKWLLKSGYKNLQINFFRYIRFSLINILLALVVSSCYLKHSLSSPENIIEITYLISQHVKYMLLIAIICCICCLPVILLPSVLMQLLLAILASILIMAMSLDIIIYAHTKMHLSIIPIAVVVLKLTNWQNLEPLIFFSCIIIIAIIEYLLLVKQKNKKHISTSYYYIIISILSLFFLLSYGIYHLSSPIQQQKLAQLTSYCSLFSNVHKSLQPMKKLDKLNNNLLLSPRKLFMPKISGNSYTLKPMQYNKITTIKNIVIIGIDGWRADRFNAKDTPNLWRYAQKGKIFTNHIAAGNATKKSNFGLFYGIPADYTDFFTATKQAPELIKRLQQLNYEIGIFFSARIDGIKLEKNVFLNIKNLRMGSSENTPALRDQQVTDDWLEWYDANQNKPMFSYLFYDSVHEYDFSSDFNQQYTPTKGKKRYKEVYKEYGQQIMTNMYDTSVSYVDKQAKKVLDKLFQDDNLKNTIIVITADHGHELNDYQQNFWGHGSNLSAAQLQIPFIIIDPSINNNKQAVICNDLTSHFDLVPTLMKNFLGAINKISDYSIGLDLFGDLSQRDWVMTTGSHKFLHFFGIVNKQHNNIKILPAGFYQQFDNNNCLIENKNINYKQVNEAFHMVKKFIH